MIKQIAQIAMLIGPTITMAQNSTFIYPTAPSDNTVDDYFGVKIQDKYRPLENDTAAATIAWVNEENALTRSYLDAIPFRKALVDRLTHLNNYAKTGMPSKESDGKYYFYKNDGLQNQSVLYRSATADGKDAEVFIDPNTLSADGTVALTGVFMSQDGKYTAYTVSRSGSDWTEIYVLDTATGKLLDDHIEWAKFTGAAWDGDGFYYSAYSKPEGSTYSVANEYHKVYYHKLGTPQSADVVIYENADEPLHFHNVGITDSRDALYVMGGGQGNGNSLFVKDLRNPSAEWITVEPSQDNDVQVIGSADGNLYILTSADAPNNRLVVVPIATPQRANWQELIPEKKDAVLVGASFAGDKLIVTYNKDASHHAAVYNNKGEKLNDITMPTYGTVAFSTTPKSDEVFYSFSSFVYPAAVYSYDMSTGESRLLRQADIEGFNPGDYVTEQVFYTSKDGTRVPMFIVRRKDLKPDAKNPVYLYGYGGFNIALNPNFSANRLLWLENGGIYAQANLRGGSEYGEAWHLAGTLQQKENVFDDFIAAGEYMVDKGWTTPDLLTIEGGSNGGLLVGACVNKRPDLFRVAIPRVGVMDMLRYHLFTIGWNWAHDYGTSADSPEMANYLIAYSPLHNIKNDGTRYPSIMVTTADHDDRVVPAHSFKYAATLQEANTGDNPKLIRIDSKAGHGAGKPISKVIDEYADIYSFIFYNLGIDPTAK